MAGTERGVAQRAAEPEVSSRVVDSMGEGFATLSSTPAGHGTLSCKCQLPIDPVVDLHRGRSGAVTPNARIGCRAGAVQSLLSELRAGNQLGLCKAILLLGPLAGHNARSTSVAHPSLLDLSLSSHPPSSKRSGSERSRAADTVPSQKTGAPSLLDARTTSSGRLSNLDFSSTPPHPPRSPLLPGPALVPVLP